MDLAESDRISERWELNEISDSTSVDLPGDPDHWTLFIWIHRWKFVTLRSPDCNFEVPNFEKVELSPVVRLRYTVPVSALQYRTPKEIWHNKLFQCLASHGVPVSEHRKFVDNIFNMARSGLTMGRSLVQVELKFTRTEVKLDNLALDVLAYLVQIYLDDEDRAVSRGASTGAILKLIGSARQVLQVDTNVCPICLDVMTGRDGKQIELPDCKHAFHCSCIVLWLEKNNTCPICRRRLEDDTHT